MKNMYKKIKGISYVEENEKIALYNAQNVFDYIKNEYINIDKEVVFIVYVDSDNHIISKELLNYGGIDYSIVDARNLFKRILNINASGFFMVHNHPSGCPKPSKEDKEVAREIKDISDKLNIRFLDNLIINSRTGFFSFFSEDLI